MTFFLYYYETSTASKISVKEELENPGLHTIRKYLVKLETEMENNISLLQGNELKTALNNKAWN